MEGKEEFKSSEKGWKLAGRNWKGKSTVFKVKDSEIGGNQLNMIAGPCAVESEEQIFSIAEFLASKKMKFIRGGAYKPRTSPYAFQGLGKKGLELLRKAADQFGLAVVTEVMDLSLLDEVYQYADILQVGTRNMHNYHFLRELGKIDKPVLLKRGMAARIEEWLMAAEYILLGGNEQVILCERGVRSFDTSTRNIMDLAAVSLVKELSHLPVIADPSQGTGRKNLIGPVSMAAVAAGTDGLMIEIHNQPEKALSDGEQSLNFKQFSEILPGIMAVASVVNKTPDFELSEDFSSENKRVLQGK